MNTNFDETNDFSGRLKLCQNRSFFKLTQVTDAGLKELAGLTTLQNLDLDPTKVTDAGLRKLRTALPDCKIFGPSVPDEGKDSSAAPAELSKSLVQEFSEVINLHSQATTDGERAKAVAGLKNLYSIALRR